MNPSNAHRLQQWILVPLTLILMTAAVTVHPSALGPLAETKVVGFLLHHRFVAAMVTLGVVSLLELGVTKAIGKGEPVVGLTIFGWVVTVFLFLTYFTVFALTAVFARLTGRVVSSRRAPSGVTYWIRRDEPPLTLESMKKQ